MHLTLVQTAEETAHIRESAVSRPTSVWERMKAEHIALIFTATAGFLLFTGQSYYDRLFRDFALKPSILAISQPELITKGVVCTTYALMQVFKENLFHWLRSGALGIAIAIILVLLSWRWVRLGNLIEKGMPLIDAFNRRWARLFLWSFGALFALTGLLAGYQGGAIDAEAVEGARHKAKNCYSVEGKLHRGVILAQDQVRTILVQRYSTAILKNEQISHVGVCPKR